MIDVYTREELDMIDDWIEKIVDSNKVMGTLHEEIHQLKAKPESEFWKKRNYILMHAWTFLRMKNKRSYCQLR